MNLNKCWKIGFVFLVVLVGGLSTAQAQVAIESSLSHPLQVLPGNEVLLQIEVENAGSSRVKDILIALDLAQLPFAPVDSSTEKIIGKIGDGDSRFVLFKLRALPTAIPGTYKIPVTLSYDGIKQTSLISQEIISLPQLSVLLDHSNVVSIGKKGEVNLKFVNNGLVPISYLTATLQESPHYEILSSKSVYIGEVDQADFETEEFTLVAKVQDPILALDLQYRDQTNQEYRTAALVSVNVYTEEEAKQLGLIESTTPVWLVILLLGIGIGGFYFIRKVRRKRRINSG